MPRDRTLERQDIESMPPISGESGSAAGGGVPYVDQAHFGDGYDFTDRIQRDMSKGTVLHELRPLQKLLSRDDLESCITLENAAFGHPEHRCTREKFIYRLTKCPELCFGIFVSATPTSDVAKAETWSTAKRVENGSERRLVLLAHAFGTKTVNDTVKDEDMDIPEDINHSTVPEVNNACADSPRKGHKEDGRTICLHSLAVLPRYQRKGVGRTLLRSYIQAMHEQQVADRVAIITYQELVELYEKFGFKNLGESKTKFGDGSWIDMVYDIS